MKVNPTTPHEIFGLMVRYLIPPFQRPYVWTEEDQWEPLWEDVVRTAEHVLKAMENGETTEKIPKHFFGAVVVQDTPTPVGRVHRKNVVDGQQRLTTLQILMDAVQEVVAKLGNLLDEEILSGLVLNNPKAVKDEEEKFKVWPSRRDRDAFVSAMTNGVEIPQKLADSPIVQAHAFFRREATNWATADSVPPDAVKDRLSALTAVLDSHIQVVAIDLSADDNEQLIFETLNARGTPLLATDLVKNFLFRSVDEAGGLVDEWESEYWGPFDDPWWQEEVSQGRYNRPRIDMFLQYWLTMRLGRDVPNDELFNMFRVHARDHGVHELSGAKALLSALKSDAATFNSFAEFDPSSPEGTFYYRVVESLELGVFTPVLLWLLGQDRAILDTQRAKALASLESWAVRRMLLRGTSKDINRLVTTLLAELSDQDPRQAGDVAEQFLAKQTAATRSWPSDAEVIESVTGNRMYGIVKQGRIRVVLEAIEDRLRTPKSEITHCPRRRLQIEHVMPQAWREHWGSDIDGDQEAAWARDRLVQTLGNLTLVNDRLNPALSNLPWLSPGSGKHKLMGTHSVLVLNHRLVTDHPESWSEADIVQRGRELAGLIVTIWPRPAS